MHATTDPARQLRPGRFDLCEHFFPLGIVRDRRHVGARQQKVCVFLGVDVLGERREHAERVLQAVPARDLREQGDVEPQPVLLDQFRRGLNATERAVEPLEDRPGAVAVVGGESGGAQHRGHVGERHRVVLRREGVDRRRDHRQLGAIEPRPEVERIGEHIGVGGLDVGDQEPPGFAREIIRRVDADVRAPDHRHTRVEQPRDHAGCLRIVQQHDVGGTNELCQQLGVLDAAALVGGALGLAQRAAVALLSVQSVVQALRDAEELAVTLDHHPACLAPTASRVADQRAQHLGDAAAVGGRVDVPERPRLEQLAPAGERVFEGSKRVGGEHAAQALGVQRGDGDFSESHRASLLHCNRRHSAPIAVAIPTLRHTSLGRQSVCSPKRL